MGDYVSTLQERDYADINTNPNSPDWIIYHVKESGLALLEVERLWLRFKQLGCGDDGILGNEVLRSSLARHDKFIKNMLAAMLGSRHRLTFRAFLKIIQWAESASNEEKLNMMFSLIQHGDPVTVDLMSRIVQALYPADTQESIWRATREFMLSVSKSDEGSVTGQQFVQAAQGLPKERLSVLLNFRTISIDVLTDAYRIFNMPEIGQEDPDKKILSEELLKNISANIGTGDITILASQLGFSSSQLDSIRQYYGDDRTRQVEVLLRYWRDRNDRKAYTGELRKALIAANMLDAAKLTTSDTTLLL